MAFNTEQFNERRRKADEKLKVELDARTPEEVAAYEEAVRKSNARIAFHHAALLAKASVKAEKAMKSHRRKCAACKAGATCAMGWSLTDDFNRVETRRGGGAQ